MIQLDIRKSESDKKKRLRLPVLLEIRLRLHSGSAAWVQQRAATPK